MKIGLTLQAEKNQRYTADAWNNNIGKTISVHLDSGTVNGTLTSAVVSEDGCSVELTLDIATDDSITKLVKNLYYEGHLEA